MLAADRVKISDSEEKGKEEHMRHFLHKTYTRKFHTALYSCKTSKTCNNVVSFLLLFRHYFFLCFFAVVAHYTVLVFA